MTTGKTIVTTLGELIEGLFGRLIPNARLPLILATIDATCVQAIDDDRLADGSRKYSADARAIYPYTPNIGEQDDEFQNEWLQAFWAWRSMLTPHDFATLNSERVVMSNLEDAQP